jgi:serine/threonine-protein kinase
MAGLAKLPEDRPADAAAFAEALMLPAGTVPEDLAAGARSAVSPVVGGMGVAGLVPVPDPGSEVTSAWSGPSP